MSGASRPLRHGRYAVLAAAAAAIVMLTLVGGAGAAGFHGISFTKGCNGTTPIGQPYTCGYQVLNIADTSLDTLRITSLIDRVFAASGTQTSPNIITAGALVATGGATCVGGSGAGTMARSVFELDQLRSAVRLLDHGAAVRVLYGAAGGLVPVLTDQADLTWLRSV